MSIHKRLATLLVAVAALAVMVSSMAFGATVYQGYDYSGAYNHNTMVYACDGEYDQRGVYSSAQSFAGNWGTANDNNGAGGYCSSNDPYFPSGVSRHNTCEIINNWPDACANYSWH